MPSIETLVAFTAAALILNLSPGPSNLYIMARSIGQGAQAGLVASLGLAVGSMLHVIASVLGLSALFKHSPTAYLVVKLAGAMYLIYLGIKYFCENDSSDIDENKNVRAKPLTSVFYESIVVEVTNPKTALFFLALLPQFVDPGAGSVSLQLFVLGAIVTISALPCDLLVATSANKMSRWISESKRAQRVQKRVSGAILFGMGAYIAADEIVVSDK
jgi:threonine/homoserine/homoserine lactone efflux protein